jgi:hypothetical protein
MGRYALTGFEDANRNREADFFEPVGDAFQVVNGSDTVFTDMSLLRPDTTAAIVSDADVVDSVTVAVEFDDYLDPDILLDEASATLARDSVPAGIAVQQILHEREYLIRVEAIEDSLWVADSLRIIESVRVVDSLLVAGDSVAVAEALAVQPPSVPAPSESRQEDPDRDLPKRTIYLLLSDTLVAEETYEVSVSGVTNINEVADGGGTEEILRALPPVNSTAIADSLALADSILAADSAAATPDSIPPDAVQPDTIRPDTVSGDTIPRDTIQTDDRQVDRTKATLLWDRPGRSVPLGHVQVTGKPVATRRRDRSEREMPPWQ